MNSSGVGSFRALTYLVTGCSPLASLAKSRTRTPFILRHAFCTAERRCPLSHSLFAPPLNQTTSFRRPLSPARPLAFSRGLSRVINIALKKRRKKVALPRTMRLIDEEGTNLGVMGSDIAAKLAESKNLKLIEVQKPSRDSEAVYRLFTSKQQWEEAKKKKKAAKSDPANTIKDLTFFSQIGEHDLSVKMSHLREFLEKGNSARVFVQTKYRRGMSEERERESRREMLKRLEVKLEGLGEKVSETAHQRRGVVCQFRPTKKKL